MFGVVWQISVAEAQAESARLTLMMRSLMQSSQDLQDRATRAVESVTLEATSLAKERDALRQELYNTEATLRGRVDELQAQLRHVKTELNTEVRISGAKIKELQKANSRVKQLEFENESLQEQLLTSRTSVIDLIGASVSFTSSCTLCSQCHCCCC